jgi:hypothetical protein
MHIHVSHGDGFAKIELLTLNVVQNYLKPKELKTALVIVEEHRDDFIRRWNEWFDGSQ